MGASLFRIYGVAQLVAIAAYYFFVPDDSWTQVFWQVAVGWTAAAAVVLGVRRSRPAGAAAWWLFGAGVFSNASGILVAGVLTRVYHVTAYPTLADLFWIVLYPALVGGLGILIRGRTSGRDWATLVDTTTITTGLGLLSWVFTIHPQAVDPRQNLIARAVVIAYPVGDVLLLAMLVRLLLGGGTRSTAFRLLVVTVFAFLASDVGWAVISHLGAEPGPAIEHALQAGSMCGFALVGAAALHPSVRDVARAAPPRQAHLSPALFAGLTIASLIAPALLILQTLRRSITDGLAIGVSSTVLFLLVVTRMAQLLRQVEAQARQLRDLARIDELTGLPNRRAWTAELPVCIERARREGKALSVAMLDLDYFKRFNDTYGHQAGDQLLRGAATAWREKLRLTDQIARYGGEEFIVVLPTADGAQARVVLERLRPATPAGQTFSAGVAAWDGVETSEELVARADRALYRAKGEGRNRTVISEERSPAVLPAAETAASG